MAQRLPLELRLGTTTHVSQMDPSWGVLLQYHVSHVYRDGTIQSSVRVQTPLLHRHSAGRQLRTKGERLGLGGTGHPTIPEGKLTMGTESTKDVQQQTPNGEDF